MIDMNKSTIHHSQVSYQTVSNTTHHSDQNTIQNQTISRVTVCSSLYIAITVEPGLAMVKL